MSCSDMSVFINVFTTQPISTPIIRWNILWFSNDERSDFTTLVFCFNLICYFAAKRKHLSRNSMQQFDLQDEKERLCGYLNKLGGIFLFLSTFLQIFALIYQSTLKASCCFAFPIFTGFCFYPHFLEETIHQLLCPINKLFNFLLNKTGI